MKRWYLIDGDNVYSCSLLSLAGKAKIGVFKSDCNEIIRFQFMKFFDFSRAKEGNKQTGWVKLPHTSEKVRGGIIFK